MMTQTAKERRKQREALRREYEREVKRYTHTPARGKEGMAGRRSK